MIRCMIEKLIIYFLFLQKLQTNIGEAKFFTSPQSKPLNPTGHFMEGVGLCNVNVIESQTLIDCSGRSLKYIDREWFPENTTELMLQSNLLTIVPNNTLNHLCKLERLSLQDNLLTFIQHKAFLGLKSLQYLNLEHNYLDLFRLPVDTFCNLTSLTELLLLQSEDLYSSNNQTLTLKNHFHNGSFPDQMFGHLHNLTTLSISVISHTLYFNEEFNHFQNLTNLTISGQVNNIPEDCFQHVRVVQKLTLFLCTGLNKVSDLALSAFLNLKSVIYEKSEFSLHGAFNTLRPLVGTEVTYLRFERVRVARQIYSSLSTKDGLLNDSSTQFLKQICLRELNLINNGILVIFRGALTSPTLNRCLKKLSISERDLFGTSWALADVLKLNNLKELSIEGSPSCGDDTTHRLVRYYPWTESEAIQLFSSDVQILTNATSNNANLLYAGSLSSFNTKEDYRESQYGITIFISPSIETIELSSLFGIVSLDVKVIVYGAQNVHTLLMLDDGIKMVTVPVDGLSSIRTMQFSNNNLSTLSIHFFNAYPSLEILVLDNCRLVSSFMSQFSSHLFQNLSRLQLLDLSSNSLDVLAHHTFSGNPELTTLNLASNRFRDIPFDLNLTPKLNSLDLRLNVITTIATTDRDVLERNKERLGYFEILLSGNIFSCGCDNLLFLQWIRLTTIQLDDNRNYTCINKDGVLTFTLVYGDLDGLWRQCWGQFFFIVSVVLMCVLFIGFLVTFLWMNNKTLIVSKVLQMFTNLKLKTLSDYRYGVFLGYADSDYEFACLELRAFIERDLKLTTFVRDRDLLPSISIAHGIMEAMDCSWRILLVINESFIDQNDWFLFTVRSAVFSISPSNPSRVVILVEKNYLDKLPSELFISVPEDNVIVLSEWKMSYRLEETLRTRLM
ncbi:toll-like receptor 4 [Biomphalaria pfeifferi]|uniref:Toll-like receptor 4 n=1 Tax=Biomphalaria pfeifferi TaxID=112525 RepID=A0AAD8FME2_BIOPF|nr:toll-like receptor 4 [Biomphalaria pfeifferi]